VILLSHPAQKGQLITAHIIDIRPRKTKLLPKLGLSPAPCSNAAARRHVCAPAP